MKLKIKVVAALVTVGIACWLSCDLENDRGRRRVVLFKRGKCNQTSAVDEHAQRGKLYPVTIAWGELVPPGGTPTLKDGQGDVWMCYAHASQWRKVVP